MEETMSASATLGRALASDYFFLRDQLSETQLETLERVRSFVDDETPGNTYNVERFIQCDLPAATVSKGNNTTTTGEPEYWA